MACCSAQTAVWVTHASRVLAPLVTDPRYNHAPPRPVVAAYVRVGSQGVDVDDGVGLSSTGTAEIGGNEVADVVASFVFASSRSFSSSG
jgi:hypothetical protein